MLLQELIDLARLQELLDDFFALTGLPSGILDREGNVLVRSGWTRLCADFHREHPKTLQGCRTNEKEVISSSGDEVPLIRTCPNGLCDVAIPIVVEGEHLATFHFSQFLLESPDLERFRVQALACGFDTEDYLDAVKKIPILSRAQVEDVTRFYTRLVGLLSDRSVKLLKLQETEQVLRTREEQLWKLVDRMPVLIHAHDAEGRYIFWNKESERVLGYTADEVCNDADIRLRLYPDEKYRKGVEYWHSRRKDYKDKAIEAVAKNGKRKVIVWSSQSEDPPIPGWDMWEVGRDVTEQVKVQKALRQSEENFRSIVQNAVEGIFRSTPEGRFLTVNPAMARLLGYASPQEMIEAIEDMSTQFYVDPGVRDTIKKRLEKEGVVTNFEFAARRKDGQVIWCRENIRHVCDAETKGCWYEGTLMDVTERKKLEGQLLQAQKLEAIGQLAAGIAHEINTPAQYVQDNIRFLKDVFGDLLEVLDHYEKACEEARAGVPLEEAAQNMQRVLSEYDLEYLKEELPQALEQSLDGIERIAAIVSSVKAFAHPGEEAKSAVDLNQAVDSTVVMTKNEWKYVADVKTTLAPDLPLVMCLPSELNQVLVILIVNAAQAIEEAMAERNDTKGEITIATCTAGEWAEIKVTDNGTGIPEHIRDRIFDPFFTTKEVGKGTGQGLSLAHTMVVEKLGGMIDFATEVGKGTTFTVRLPLESDHG